MKTKLFIFLLLTSNLSVSSVSTKIVNILDISKFKEKVIYLGERHDDVIVRKKFQESLKELQRNGISDLALEMIKDNNQERLNNYCNKIDQYEDEMRSLLNQDWSYDIGSYQALIREACILGIRVHGIDLPLDLLPDEEGLFPVPPSLSLRMKARDERMAFNIAKIVKEADGKVLVLVGKYHTNKNSGPKILHNKFGIKSKSFIFNFAPQFDVDGAIEF